MRFTVAMLLECHGPGSRRRWWLSLPRTTGMHRRVRRRSLHLTSTIWTAHSRQKAAQHSRHWFHGADPKRVGGRVVCLLRSSTLYLLAGPESCLLPPLPELQRRRGAAISHMSSPAHLALCARHAHTTRPSPSYGQYPHRPPLALSHPSAAVCPREANPLNLRRRTTEV